MTVQLASEIVLSEVDIELTLLGSLLTAPAAFELVAGDIDAEWFSDPFARYLFEAAHRIHEAGNRLSPPIVVAELPLQCGALSRGEFYARAVATALPATSLGGLIATLKDRWARRRLIESAGLVRSRATLFSEDPFVLAGECIAELDTINASHSSRASGSLDDTMRGVIASLDAPEALRGASTGLLALDTKLNGYRAGQLYVIAGRPGMGKSAFMCSSLRRTAQTGRGVAIFSLEMTGHEIGCRMASDTLDTVHAPTYGSVLKGLVSTADRDDLNTVADSLAGLPLSIDDSPRLTFSEIAARARRQKALYHAEGIELAVICIDHMGLVTPSDRYRGNKVAEAGEVSGQARALAKELNCCVVLLCQLSREVERRDDKRPIMSDLRWSGEIEQDAHVIGFLYREAYYLAQDPAADPWKVSDARHKLEFLIRKNRNGETADIRLWCSIAHSSIRDDL